MNVLLETTTLTVTAEETVATITLTRPELLNRFDEQLHLDFLGAEPDIRAAVLASTGSAFSAGGDFDFIRKATADLGYLINHADVGRRLVTTLLEVPFPIVAAVHGPAVGLGATVVLGCDAVVAARDATFLADPHVVVGLAAGDGGCLFWPQSMGMLMAKRFLLTGDRLTAEDALRYGMVTDLVDSADEVAPAARELADKIAALPPLAVQHTKRALNNVMRARASEVLDLAMAYETVTVQSQDIQEALDAAKQRRPGVYAKR